MTASVFASAYFLKLGSSLNLMTLIDSIFEADIDMNLFGDVTSPSMTYTIPCKFTPCTLFAEILEEVVDDFLDVLRLGGVAATGDPGVEEHYPLAL